MDDKIIMKYAKYLKEVQPPDKNTLPYKKRIENCTLEEAGYLINNLEYVFSTAPKEFSRGHIICNLSELIVAFGLVHATASEDQDYSSEDFPETAKNAVECFKYLKILLENLNPHERANKRFFLIDTILLIATHSETYHWSNEDSIQASKDCILEHTRNDDLTSLLCDEYFNPKIFKGILKKMRPMLLKDTWMLNPSSCYIFYWLLSHVKHPDLADYLSDVFPPPFMFVSYHHDDQKVIGMKCFDHLLDNVPPSLMVLTGNEDAIFHTLHPLIHSHERPIIQILFSCLLKLPMMKIKQKKYTFWGDCDQVLLRLLNCAEFEHDPQKKKLYLSHVRDFIVCTSPMLHLKAANIELIVILKPASFLFYFKHPEKNEIVFSPINNIHYIYILRTKYFLRNISLN
ncbi:UNVERIFIED_CONTAM: Tti2 [Trichonephila clavipes]